MALWNVNHVLTTEDRLTKEVNSDYEQVLAQAWYEPVIMERPGEGRADQIEFLLTTAGIDSLDKGSMTYSDLVTASTVITHGDFGKGIRISRNDFEDDMFAFAKDAAASLGTAIALHPQKLALDLIKNGGTKKGYDGSTFFSTTHPINPFNTGAGTYSNLNASGMALTADNFSTVVGQMQSYKMPNGESRNLHAEYILVPPALRKAALEVTSAEFLGQASGGTNQNVLKGYGVKVIVIPDLAGADTTWYTVATMPGTLGRPLIYSRRRAFEMTSYDGMTQAELGRLNELEWQFRGRAQGSYGHSFLMTKNAA